MNKRQKIALLIVNLVLIIELCLAIYLSSRDPENITPVFLQYFIFLIVPTFIISRFIIKRLRTKEPENVTTAEMTKPHAPISAQQYPQEIPLRRPVPRELNQATDKVKRMGKIVALFFIILMLSIFDSCFARFRQPINLVKILPGMSVQVNGPLEQKVKGVQDLTYVCDTDLIHLSLDSVYSGFWFGGNEWNGTLKVSPHIETGEYRLTVMPKIQLSKKPQVVHLIWVYQDEISLQKSSTSIIKQHTGVSPWLVIAIFFPLIVLGLVTVYFFSTKVEHIREKEGEAEVYWMSAGLAGTAIAFGLGTKHGVKMDDRLFLYTGEGKPAGTVSVQKVAETDSIGITGPDCEVRIGYIVSVNKQ